MAGVRAGDITGDVGLSVTLLLNQKKHHRALCLRKGENYSLPKSWTSGFTQITATLSVFWDLSVYRHTHTGTLPNR